MTSMVPTRNRNRRGNELGTFGGFDDFFQPLEDIFLRNDFTRNMPLNTDIDEDENNYYVRAEVPGLTKDDIEIDYKEGMMTLTAEWNENTESGLRKGKFEKSFSVNRVDIENAEASIQDGILKITLPKSQEAKTQKIDIK